MLNRSLLLLALLALSSRLEAAPDKILGNSYALIADYFLNNMQGTERFVGPCQVDPAMTTHSWSFPLEAGFAFVFCDVYDGRIVDINFTSYGPLISETINKLLTVIIGRQMVDFNETREAGEETWYRSADGLYLIEIGEYNLFVCYARH